MDIVVQANVLTIGLDGKEEILHELPIDITAVNSASQAAKYLKSEHFDSVISKWILEDINGKVFLQRLRTVKPDVPMIVFIKADEPEEEIAARSIGVSMVLTEDCTDQFFIESVISLLGLKVAVPEKISTPVKA